MIHLAKKRSPYLRYTAALICLIPLLSWSHHAHADARPPQSVTALWSTKNHLDVFVVDRNGVVVSSWWEGGMGWQPWFAISPTSAIAAPGQPVTAVWSNPQHLDLFITGRDGRIMSSWWGSGKGWQPWFAISPESATAAPGQPVIAVWSNPQHLDLFITGQDGRVTSAFWETRWGWQPWLPISPTVSPMWGGLANPGFTNQRIKATLFFAGQARDGTNPYDCIPPPGNNLLLYTTHPLDNTVLKWSENAANRNAALNQMVQAGINVINMSSWGEDFLRCAWVTGAAPMQTSPRGPDGLPGAHDELFAAAVGKPLLVAPFLETRGGSSMWNFRSEFPRRADGLLAPGTISQIVNLIDRYLKNPSHPEWAEKWARVYDENGEERFTVVIIHAASDLLASGDDALFAAGLDAVAYEVLRQTGEKIGFFIDALPFGTNAPGAFKPTAEATGPELKRSQSLLGIECFIPEIWFGSSDTKAVIKWKTDFSRRWFQTGIPFLMDVSPGYDGHIVFGGSPPVYGCFPAQLVNRDCREWLRAMSQLNREFGQDGMVVNSWNGYTESLAAVPSKELGSLFYDWLQSQ